MFTLPKVVMGMHFTKHSSSSLSTAHCREVKPAEHNVVLMLLAYIVAMGMLLLHC